MNAPGRAVKDRAGTNRHLLVEIATGDVPVSCLSSPRADEEASGRLLKILMGLATLTSPSRGRAGAGREQLLTWLCKSSSPQHHLRGHWEPSRLSTEEK